jgi:hypothetical protein
MQTVIQKLRWIGVSAIAVSVGLSGCAQTVNGIASNQGQHGINPDSVQQPNHAPKSLVKELSPTSLWETPIDPAKPANELRGDGNPNSRNKGVNTCGPNKNTFCELQERSRIKDDDPIIARNYLLVGITLSNELCDVWFNKLYSSQITFRQTSDIISATGSLSAAILGYSRADSRVSGLTASVFGVGKQITDSVVANYVIAPDLTSVAVAVREYRSLYATKLESAQTEWNYYTARRAIMAYDNSCSALSVKRFINARISGTQPEESPQPLLELATSKLLVEWKDKFKVPVNTVADLVDVYAYLTVADDSANSVLKEDAKKLAPDLVLFKEGHDLPELVSKLREANISEYVSALVNKKVLNIKSKIPSQAAVSGTNPENKGSTSEAKGMPIANDGRPVDIAPK